MNWHDKTSVKKGDLGELLVDNYLIKKGLIPYSPSAGGAHPFDRLIASRDKKKLYIADVKTKARRNKYPDTGMNKRHFEEYLFVMEKYSIPVFVFFVDEMLGKIYGNFLAELKKERIISESNRNLKYPMVCGDIIYFPLAAMLPVCDLKAVDSQGLKALSDRKHEYSA